MPASAVRPPKLLVTSASSMAGASARAPVPLDTSAVRARPAVKPRATASLLAVHTAMDVVLGDQGLLPTPALPGQVQTVGGAVLGPATLSARLARAPVCLPHQWYPPRCPGVSPARRSGECPPGPACLAGAGVIPAPAKVSGGYQRYQRRRGPPEAAPLKKKPSSHRMSTIRAIHHSTWTAKPSPPRMRAIRRTARMIAIVVPFRIRTTPNSPFRRYPNRSRVPAFPMPGALLGRPAPPRAPAGPSALAPVLRDPTSTAGQKRPARRIDAGRPSGS